jgi:hypothetical protein
MKCHNFEWTTNHFQHTERAIDSAAHLSPKVLGVVMKHALIPFSDYPLAEWGRYDHYREDLSEIEIDVSDKVWLKPWLIGQWMGGKECVLQLEPNEILEEVYQQKEWAELDDWTHRHNRGAIFGFYFTVNKQSEGWSAVFGLRVDDKNGAEKVHDLPVKELVCLSAEGDLRKMEAWLDWAYKEAA